MQTGPHFGGYRNRCPLNAKNRPSGLRFCRTQCLPSTCPETRSAGQLGTLPSRAAFFGWIPTAPAKPAKAGREAVSTAHLGQGDYPLMWITSGWPTHRVGVQSCASQNAVSGPSRADGGRDPGAGGSERDDEASASFSPHHFAGEPVACSTMLSGAACSGLT